MGARITAHVANASIPALLLDMVPREPATAEKAKGLTLDHPQVRNRLARAGLEAALKSRPAAFFVPEAARMIAVGNFEDNLAWIKDCDWIIEAVTEDRNIKRALLEKAQAFLAPGAIASSNTSGISIASIAEGFSEEFRRHWLGTHFFNPPRYMKLLEVVPTADTRPEVIETVRRFADLALGKGTVIAKDSPNFIANRIGTFLTLDVIRIMQEGGYTIEEIDTLTGPAMGLPKSATFRTLDLVGLDVLVHVVKNLEASLPHDERRDLFRVPDFVTRMIERKLLGEKTGQGFYERVKGGDESEILTLDLQTFEYRPRQKPKLPALEMAKNVEDTRQRGPMLLQSPDRAGEFYRKVIGDTFHYAANRIPEISDDIVSIDNAMKWGFNWESGVFELWDAVGVEKGTEQWKKEKRPIPPLAEKLLTTGRKAFYQQSYGQQSDG